MEHDIHSVKWADWKTVRKIGTGSYGTVFEIQRDVYGDMEKAALKVISVPFWEGEIENLRSNGMDDNSIGKAFLQQAAEVAKEYKLMAQLRGHPNVVRCDDFQDVAHPDGMGWDILIKMELLTPLFRCLDKVNNEAQVIKLGKNICAALVACHQRDIIHRDIKPQNIFMTENGTFKLGDFGIARTIERTNVSVTSRIGTYTYMAPEVATGTHYTKTADIYSLGITLYWLLNERRTPFMPLPPAMPQHTDDEVAKRRRFSGEPIPAPLHGSEGLKRIVLKACAFRSADRYQSAEEMYADLEKLDNAQLLPEDDKTVVVNRAAKTAQFCDNCGNALPQTAKVCPRCGHRIQPVVIANIPADNTNSRQMLNSVPEPKPKKKRSKLPIILISILLLLAAAFAAVYFCTDLLDGLFDQGAEKKSKEEKEKLTQVESVSLEIVAPTAPRTPSYNVALEGEGVRVAVDKKDGYIYQGVIWNDATDNRALIGTDLFVKDHDYTVEIYLETEEGYSFEDTSFAINGLEAEVMEGDYLIVSVTFTDIPYLDGWVDDPDGWHYYEDGKIATSRWIQGKEENWYYVNETGKIVKNDWLYLEGEFYYVDAEGRRATNSWRMNGDGQWRYLGADGKIVYNDWAEHEEGTFYMGEDGNYRTSAWINYQNQWYYVGEDGVMYKNKWLHHLDGAWYHFGVQGIMETSTWVDNKYYVDSEGRMLRNGTYYVDGYYYYFDSEGVCYR